MSWVFMYTVLFSDQLNAKGKKKTYDHTAFPIFYLDSLEVINYICILHSEYLQNKKYLCVNCVIL